MPFSPLRCRPALLATLGLALTSTALSSSAQSPAVGTASVTLHPSQAPLLAPWGGPHGGVPAFDKVKVANFKPALEAAMAENLAEVAAIANNPKPATFDNTIVALERSGQALTRVATVYDVWSSTLNGAAFSALETEMAPRLAAPLDVAAVDAAVARTLKEFNVPGISVAVVKDGQVVLAKGYGVRSLKTKEPMDANTLVGIASNTKAFTAAALGLLVDEGKLKWDDKVTDYIPEFRMYDPYVTAEFTVRDLLCHRSGLGLGAGDLMFFPDSSNFTVKDVIHNLRYFKPVSSFRSKYDYDNNLYIVAGEVVARISGQPWADFVEARLVKPLGMTRTATDFTRLPDPTNVIDAHGPVEGKVQVIQRDRGTFAAPCGGMYSSVNDLSKWVLMLLGGPDAPAPLLKPQTQWELWSPQTILPVRPVPAKYLPYSYNTHFSAYGLGWVLRDVQGYKEIAHTGGQIGMVTEIKLIPELHLGIMVLTNQENGAAFTAISTTIEDHYLGIKGLDRVQLLTDAMQDYQAEEAKELAAVWKQVATAQKAAPKKPDYKAYVGRYHDAWLGDVNVYQQGQQLWLRAVRAPRLVGQVLPYRGSTCVVRWKARSFNADAFATFALDDQGRAAGLKLKPISTATDFSYDFQDLDLQRVE